MNDYTKNQLEKYMNLYGLTQKGWKYRINKRKHSAGVTKYITKFIEISHYYINSEKITKNDITNTILHEIAHSLTRGEGHNNIWKNKFIEIGGNGNQYSKKFSLK